MFIKHHWELNKLLERDHHRSWYAIIRMLGIGCWERNGGSCKCKRGLETQLPDPITRQSPDGTALTVSTKWILVTGNQIMLGPLLSDYLYRCFSWLVSLNLPIFAILPSFACSHPSWSMLGLGSETELPTILQEQLAA